MSELRVWNGAAIKFSGFGWDYAGGIFAVAGSPLANCATQCRLDLNVEFGVEGYEEFFGDTELSTEDASTIEAPIMVSELSYYIPE